MELEVNGIIVRGDSSELKDLVLQLAGKPEAKPEAKPITATLGQPQPAFSEPLVEHPPEVAFFPNREVRVNFESRYFSNLPGKRRFKKVAAVFDYIERYVNGRTTEQIVEYFGMPKQSAWSTLGVLRDNEKLIYQPGSRGSTWIAVPEELEPTQKQVPAAPARMPTHMAPTVQPQHRDAS